MPLSSRITFTDDHDILVDALRVGTIETWPKGWVVVLYNPFQRTFYTKLADALASARGRIVEGMTGVPDGRLQ